jgi:saccharopine dehydrogenase-like NADP-dependent oxidoreductase
MKEVLVVIGPGQIGQAIARRVGVAKHLLLADVRQENANAAAEVLGNVGYEVSVATVDASSREAVHALIETAEARRSHRADTRGGCLPYPGVASDNF